METAVSIFASHNLTPNPEAKYAGHCRMVAVYRREINAILPSNDATLSVKLVRKESLRQHMDRGAGKRRRAGKAAPTQIRIYPSRLRR